MTGAIRLGLSGVVLIVLGRLAAAGRLRRNILAGIRIPSTMRSDEAWYAGHRAASSSLAVSGLGPVAIAVIVGATEPDPETRKLLLRVARAWLLAWLGLAVFQASRAARAANAG